MTRKRRGSSMAKKRTKASELVKGSKPRNIPFLDTLSNDDLKYFYEVVEAMIQTPEASPYVVAGKLKEELNSVAALTTIVRALKGAMQ
jgi:hypothetical protein